MWTTKMIASLICLCLISEVICDNDANFIKFPLNINSTYTGVVQIPSNQPNPKFQQFTKLIYINSITPVDSNKTNYNNESYTLPANCVDILCQGNNKSGIYQIFPRPWTKVKPFWVWCDMATDGGGWLVFHRRSNFAARKVERLNFTQTWDQYANGFGNLTEEFWLGNDKISFLTDQYASVLRVDLAIELIDGLQKYAVYNTFRVAPKEDSYQLTAQNYEGTAGDSLAYHSNATFSTYDRDNTYDCSKIYRGGWWYRNCHTSNLNGVSYVGEYTGNGEYGSQRSGIEWSSWTGASFSLPYAEMKMRPKMFKSC